MTVSIRPGRYSVAVIEGAHGRRRQTPWLRTCDINSADLYFRSAAWLHRGERIVYLVHAILPPPNEQGERP